MRIACPSPLSSFALLISLAPAPALAQAPAPSPAPRAAQAPTRPATPAVPPVPAQVTAVQAASPTLPDRNAHETRGELMELLRKHPPSLASVLKLDPSLLDNPEYLAAYPELAAFLGLHPEVAHNPRFYFEDVRVDSDGRPLDARAQMIDITRNMVEGFMTFAVFLVVTAALIWLIRTLIDYRRWSRLSRVQAEVHNKLLDRFAANETLIAYIESDAGRRFLESAPIPLDTESRTLAAPLGRILWSLQAGVVVAMAGLGLQFVSRRVPEEVSLPVSVMGALALAIGIGFVLSAAASYYLSRRLGLVAPPAADSTSQPGASA